MTKIMLKMIPLIFQGIERFILDSPASPTATHQLIRIFLGDGEISNPTEMLCLFAGLYLPILQKVDAYIGIGRVEWRIINEAKPMDDPFFFNFKAGGLTGLIFLSDKFKQIGMVTWFHADNEAQVMSF